MEKSENDFKSTFEMGKLENSFESQFSKSGIWGINISAVACWISLFVWRPASLKEINNLIRHQQRDPTGEHCLHIQNQIQILLCSFEKKSTYVSA